MVFMLILKIIGIVSLRYNGNLGYDPVCAGLL